MQRIPLTAEIRTETGKGPAARIRREGNVPGVLYGKKTETTSVTLNARDLTDVLKVAAGSTALIDLTLAGGSPQLCMVKDVQRDPVTRGFVSIDLQGISMDEQITVEVPIVGEGTPEGVTEGGILQQLMRTITVSCLPTNIPGDLTIDISGLAIGQSLKLSELTIPEGVAVDLDFEEAIFTVSAPAAEEEVEAEEGVEGVEGEAAEGEGEAAEGEGAAADDESGDE